MHGQFTYYKVIIGLKSHFRYRFHGTSFANSNNKAVCVLIMVLNEFVHQYKVEIKYYAIDQGFSILMETPGNIKNYAM